MGKTIRISVCKNPEFEVELSRKILANTALKANYTKNRMRTYNSNEPVLILLTASTLILKPSSPGSSPNLSLTLSMKKFCFHPDFSIVYCITKKSDMINEEFFDYWKNIHRPIGVKIPGLRKLVQSHTVSGTDQIGSADYDGMAELWFDDMQALLRARNTAEWRASTEDEKNFIDHSKVVLFITEEHEIV